MSQNYVDTNTHLVLNDMTESQFSNLQSVDPDQLYLTEDVSANQDLSNLTNAGRILGSGLGMPSNTYVDLTLGSSGAEYTAPSNGWVSVCKAGNAGQQITITTKTANDAYGVNFDSRISSDTDCRVSLPVAKGQKFIVYWTASGSLRAFRFYYAQGSESEAS